MINCPFCNPRASSILMKNDLCYAILDISPVTNGHLLIIPFRHVETYFDATREEKHRILDLVDMAKTYTEQRYSPEGYNIGVNVGEAAGQSIPHAHIHFIPRYRGDTEEIAGGIRRVVARYPVIQEVSSVP